MTNPMIKAFSNTYAIDGEPMTVQGAVSKTFLLLAIACLSAMITWNLTLTNMSDKANMLVIFGGLASFVCVILAAFNVRHSKILSIAYAFFEGLFLGGFSALFHSAYGGIVGQAVLATFVTLFVMLFLYRTGVIKATPKFKKVLMVALISIMLFYLIVFITSVFKISFLMPFMGAYNSIWVNAIIIVVAALFLIIDFDMIENGSNSYLPKYFEWYSAMTLMVTLVWLYMEFLKIFAKMRNR